MAGAYVVTQFYETLKTFLLVYHVYLLLGVFVICGLLLCLKNRQFTKPIVFSLSLVVFLGFFVGLF